MDWIKRHKLWSLVILYFVVGAGASFAFNPLAVGQMVGILFWAYLFVCFIVVRLVERIWGDNEKV